MPLATIKRCDRGNDHPVHPVPTKRDWSPTVTVLPAGTVGEVITVADLTGDPHPVLARLRERTPVAWVPALNGWLVTSHELATRVMRDPDGFTVDDPRFSTAQVVGPSMLSLDGGAHTRHRGPFAPAFRPAAVRTRFAGFVESTAAQLVSAMRSAGEGDVRREVAGPLAVAVVAEVLGLRADPPKVLAWYAAIVDAVQGVSAGHEVSSAGRAAFDELSASVRSSTRSSSLLGDVAGLGRTEVVSNAAVMMFGGIETTEGMITNAVLHLAADLPKLPDAKVDNAIEESLRMEPAAAVVDRYATRDTPLGGADIRRGDLVIVSIAGANRDPAVFPNPDAFLIDRPNARQHLAFAHGPHVCIAADLARLETRAVLRALRDNLPGVAVERFTPPEGLVFRKPKELHLRWA